jgi:nicotinamide-nucleotide amidase
MIKAEIITIGDEILIGQIVDTNSAWMGKKLNEIGISVHQISSISDNKTHIQQALKDAFKRVDIVLMTGGLGPTKDDITKQSLADYFNTRLITHEATLEFIRNLTSTRGFSMNPLNEAQALVPANCIPLDNPNGTAPGMLFHHKGKLLFSMPGIPLEMKGLMEKKVIPHLKASFKTPFILHKTIIVQGYSESKLSLDLDTWESMLPEEIKLAYLPSPGRIRMRFSLQGHDRAHMEAILAEELEKLTAILGKSISSYDEEGIEEVVAKLLLRKKASMASAESCTGGSIAALITSQAGSSAFFKGSVVAYSNEIKTDLLGVEQSAIDQYGAVSKEVVEQMASGSVKVMKVDYAVATSGIAGPDGGTEEKPVGTVWIAVASRDEVRSKLYTMGNNRHININKSVQLSLSLLRELLVEK